MRLGCLHLRPAFVVCLGSITVVAGCSWLAGDEGPISARTLRPDYDPAVHSADPIKEFGVARSDPIHNGFFFHKHRYVEGPYVVERRGLAIYVNGILMGDFAEWPPFDETVSEDPGAPPPGASPFDPTPAGEDHRNDYWSRKWRYLRQRHGFRRTFRKMVETYRKCDELRSVRASPREGRITVVDRSGRRLPMIFLPCYHPRPLKRDDILARAEGQRQSYETELARGCFRGMESGFASVVGPKLALPLMEALVSSRLPEEKMEALARIPALGPPGEEEQETVRRFKHSAELAEKVRRLRKRE